MHQAHYCYKIVCFCTYCFIILLSHHWSLSSNDCTIKSHLTMLSKVMSNSHIIKKKSPVLFFFQHLLSWEIASLIYLLAHCLFFSIEVSTIAASLVPRSILESSCLINMWSQVNMQPASKGPSTVLFLYAFSLSPLHDVVCQHTWLIEVEKEICALSEACRRSDILQDIDSPDGHLVC